MKLFALTLALLFLCPGDGFANAAAPLKKGGCVMTRAGFDIGSGATKLKVARVDVCRNRVLQILYPTNAKERRAAVLRVGYKKDLTKSMQATGKKQGTLSRAIQQQGARALTQLRGFVQRRFPEASFAGVATSAFRQAKNGQRAVAFLRRVSGVPVTIISQREEGLLGARAVFARFSSKDQKNLVVWDIGGSSMQLVYRDEKGRLDVYLGHLASVPMSTWIIQTAQGATLRSKRSPNPVQADDARRGVAYVARYASRDLKKKAPLLFQRIASGKVVGIGGVHGFSVLGQAAPGQTFYTASDVRNALQQRLAMSDREVARRNKPLLPLSASPFVKTEVTNLILIQGFLKALQIARVEVLSINLTDGVFVSPAYWSKP